jgi:hypothetical protein
MVRLNQSWEDARQKLIVGLLPALTQLANFLAVEIPAGAKLTEQAFDLFDNKKNRHGTISHFLNGLPVVGPSLRKAWEGGNQPGVSIAADAIHGIKRFSALDSRANVTAGFTGSNEDQTGLTERQRQQNAVGGHMFGEKEIATKPVKFAYDVDPLNGRPIYLVATDGTELAKVVMKGVQKTQHAQGRTKTR